MKYLPNGSYELKVDVGTCMLSTVKNYLAADASGFSPSSEQESYSIRILMKDSFLFSSRGCNVKPMECGHADNASAML